MVAELTLKKRLEKVIAQGHPWVYRDALAGKLPDPGRVVTVVDKRGNFVARGLAEEGPIGLRLFLTRDEPLDAKLFEQRIRAAATLRRQVVPSGTTAFRLLHGEGDRLPGVVCDVYGDHAVVQFDGRAAQEWSSIVLDALGPVVRDLGVDHLLLRSGRREGKKVAAHFGTLPEAPIQVREHGMRLLVDLEAGQKTGLFLDHRESRRTVRELSGGLRVLNLFGYTGGFSVAAGLGGAQQVITVDRSKSACELADQNWVLNGLESGQHLSRAEPVQPCLEALAKKDERFGLIVSDPPSFAPSEKKVPDGLRAYQALHRAALDRLQADGLLLAASCSSHIGPAAFEKSVLGAARRDGRVLQVLGRWGAPADHPRLSAFAEGDYLKVLLVRLVS